jgi:glycosyltransferase involved in cell wall biosynthesis
MATPPNSAPLVSVIITCFNQAQVIAQTVHSVLDQTYPHIECVVINDGSTDGSEVVLRSLAATDRRVKCISQRNSGVSAARNRGFAAATGDFIQFLDGDDLLDAEKIEKQILHFCREPTTDVSWTLHRFSNADASSFSSHPFKPIHELPLEQFLFGWHNGVSLPLHAPLYRRRLWSGEELPFPSDYSGRCEDWIFLVLVAMKGARFGFLDETLCTYRMSTEGFTRDPLELRVAFLTAAVWLQSRIPMEYQGQFLKEAIQNSLIQYVDEMKPDILYASWNWRFGNCISRPFLYTLQRIRQLRLKLVNGRKATRGAL